jgi:hypothetical protein
MKQRFLLYRIQAKRRNLSVIHRIKAALPVFPDPADSLLTRENDTRVRAKVTPDISLRKGFPVKCFFQTLLSLLLMIPAAPLWRRLSKASLILAPNVFPRGLSGHNLPNSVSGIFRR